jgi:hypothetical protein
LITSLQAAASICHGSGVGLEALAKGSELIFVTYEFQVAIHQAIVRERQKIPQVMSPNETRRLLAVASISLLSLSRSFKTSYGEVNSRQSGAAR